MVKTHSDTLSLPDFAVEHLPKLCGRNWTYCITKRETTLGNSDPGRIVDVDIGPSRGVSTIHARIVYSNKTWSLQIYGPYLLLDDNPFRENQTTTLLNGYLSHCKAS